MTEGFTGQVNAWQMPRRHCASSWPGWSGRGPPGGRGGCRWCWRTWPAGCLRSSCYVLCLGLLWNWSKCLSSKPYLENRGRKEWTVTLHSLKQGWIYTLRLWTVLLWALLTISHFTFNTFSKRLSTIHKQKILYLHLIFDPKIFSMKQLQLSAADTDQLSWSPKPNTSHNKREIDRNLPTKSSRKLLRAASKSL